MLTVSRNVAAELTFACALMHGMTALQNDRNEHVRNAIATSAFIMRNIPHKKGPNSNHVYICYVRLQSEMHDRLFSSKMARVGHAAPHCVHVVL